MMHKLLFLIAILGSFPAYALLVPIGEQELAEIDGGSIGLILNDISLSSEIDSSNVGSISLEAEGLQNGPTGSLFIDKLYLVGEGASPHSVDAGNGATFGSISDPFEISIISKNYLNYVDTNVVTQTKALINLAFPANSVKDADIGLRLTTRAPIKNTTAVSSDVNWLRLKGFNANGSYLQLWADKDIGFAAAGRIKLHADSFSHSLRSTNGGVDPDFDSVQGQESGFRIEGGIDIDLPLGRPFYQPIQISIGKEFSIARNPSGPDTIVQGLTVELPKIPNKKTIYDDFYAAPKGRIEIQGTYIGNHFLGRSVVDGIQIQHLKVTTRELN